MVHITDMYAECMPYNLVCGANVISYHSNFARLLCAGEREVVQSMSEVAVIDRDPVLSLPVHCE